MAIPKLAMIGGEEFRPVDEYSMYNGERPRFYKVFGRYAVCIESEELVFFGFKSIDSVVYFWNCFCEAKEESHFMVKLNP